MAQKGPGSTPHERAENGHDDGRTPRTPGSRRVAPEVYRRRRIVAALAAAVLLVLVAVGVVSAVAAMLGPEDSGDVTVPEAAAPSTATVSQEPFADFTPRPDESASGSASAAPREEPVEECGAALEVRASTDRETYPEGTEPVLVLSLENTGDDPCLVDAGTTRMVYEVTSGSDTVFDSRHCQAGAEDRQVTLEPGQEQSARLTWNLARTAEGCTETGGLAQPGYYRLVVSLGERTSDPAPFVLE